MTDLIDSLSISDIVEDRNWFAEKYSPYFGSIGIQGKLDQYGPKAYERFMYLCAKYPAKVSELLPTPPIEYIMRAHCCDPIHFEKDWIDIVGKLFDFRPTNKDSKETNDLWKEEYLLDLVQEFVLAP